LSSASTAGIAIGLVLVLMISCMTCLWLRRSRKKQQRQMARQPQVYIPAPDDEQGIRHILSSSEKSGSPGGQSAQESLAEQLRAMQEQLAVVTGAMGQGGGDLEQALRQNESLQAHIRALERELQFQNASESSDQPPPGYLD
jgi:hypothetical protein